MTAGAAHKSRGFTIIEIMVAMAIFVMIVAAVYSSWMAIVRGAVSGRKAAAAVQRSRIAVRTLEDALTSVRAFASDVQYYSFVGENGDDASLSFVAKLPESFPRSGRFGSFDVRRVTFSLESGADSGRQLVLRQQPVLMDMDIDEKEHPIVLEKDVKAFELQFWDVNSSDWLDDWAQTNQLPLMVKIKLRLGGNPQHASSSAQEITRVVSLPPVMVPNGWQGGNR